MAEPSSGGVFLPLKDQVVEGEWRFQDPADQAGAAVVIGPTGIANGQPHTQTGAFTNTGGITGAGAVTSSSPSAGIGYATGAGGAVVQQTNRTTGVTLSTICGQITTDNASLGAELAADFTVTNTQVAARDVVVICQGGGAVGVATSVWVEDVQAGSFIVRVYNGNAAGGTAETGAIILNFAIIKAVNA